MQVTVTSLEEFQDEAIRFAKTLKAHADEAVVVALSGDLGAGKTTFVQAVAGAFGITEPVTSPTFVIEKAYDLQGRPFARLIHIDAYRLTSARDLAVLGWSELIADPANLILIEWPENVPGLMPEDAHHIQLEEAGEGRTIIYG